MTKSILANTMPYKSSVLDAFKVLKKLMKRAKTFVIQRVLAL